MSAIDHLEISVKNAPLSLRFYQQALEPLGFRLVITQEPAKTRTGGFRYGLGPQGYPGYGCMTMRKPVHRCIWLFLLISAALWISSGNRLFWRAGKITEHREFVSIIIHNTMQRTF